MNISIAAMVTACAGAAMLAGCGRQSEAEDMFTGRICAFGSTPATGKTTGLGPPSPEAVKIVQRISDGVGIRANFKIVAADIERYAKAFATVRDGQRYIVYNRKNFRWSKGQAGWADVATMAHEVGHHIASHVYVNEYSGHEQELEADRFSGFAMARLGASLKQATARFGNATATKYHPSGADRRKAVEQGWKEGRRMMNLEAEPCTAGWTGQPVDVDGSLCRVARVCTNGRSQTRLACEEYDGTWRWMTGGAAE